MSENNKSFGDWVLLFQRSINHLKLTWRLWQDPRINTLLKALPLGAFVYWLSPIDLFPTFVDDIGVVWFFTQLFISLSPADVVAEHRRDLGVQDEEMWEQEVELGNETVVDAEFEEK